LVGLFSLVFELQILEFITKKKLFCVEDTVSKLEAGRQHNYLYVTSPGGTFSVISLRRAVTLTSNQMRATETKEGREMTFPSNENPLKYALGQLTSTARSNSPLGGHVTPHKDTIPKIRYSS